MVHVAEIITTLTNAVGLSGNENQIHELIKTYFAPLVDEVSISKVGSVIGVKWGGAPLQNASRAKRLMLAAHLDEIGMIVSGIEKEFLRIARVGGTDARIMLGQRVLVHPAGRRDGKGPHAGVIASRPPHVLPADKRDKVVGFDDLFVDIGLTAAQVAREIQVGDLVSFDVETVKLRGDLLTGKAMDDRAAVATMIVCLDELQRLKHGWDVVAVATAGEETSFAGATTSTYAIQPDAAIAIDVTFANQHDYSSHVELGKGPAIAVGPNYHPKLRKRLIDVAKRLDMGYQIEPDIGGGTDAWPIQISRSGVPTAQLGLPLRYMHSPVETVNIKDVERVGRLMAHFAAELAEEI
ncbi:MAG TPA: M20/M25/M40 family metallo-hydrolase [Anaerolineae bacterium]|jgi:endoglucanase